MVIRKAERRDCIQLLGLVQELAAYEKAPEEVTVTLAHFEESGFGQTPVWWAYVAEENDVIIGMALYYIRYSTWKGKVLYLEDLLVTESWRGKGIGKQLFDKLLVVAKEEGYTRMSWQVLDWNDPAINFYKKYSTSFDGEWVNCSVAIM